MAVMGPAWSLRPIRSSGLRQSESVLGSRPKALVGDIHTVASRQQILLEFEALGLKRQAPRQASMRMPLISSFSLYLATVNAPGQIPGTELSRFDSSVQQSSLIAHFVLNHRQLGFLEQASAKGACV